MNKLEKFLLICDDFLNPILVKELRQIIRGKLIWLIITFCICLQAIFIYNAFSEENVLSSYDSGKNFFFFLFQALMLVTIFIVPLYNNIRFINERVTKSDELVYITTATPFDIIKGRFYACMITVIMIYSIAAPFMCLLFYLPRFSITFCLSLILIGISFAALSSSILLNIACLITSGTNTRINSTMATFYSFFVQIFLYFFLNAFLSGLERDNTSFVDNIYIVYGIVAFVLSITYLFLRTAANLVKTVDGNDMFSIRMLFVAIWGISLAICWQNVEATLIWATTFMIIILVFMAGCFGEPDEYSTQVYKDMAKRKNTNFLLFPFYTGFTNAITWGAILSVSTVLILHESTSRAFASGGSYRTFSGMEKFWAYFLFIFIFYGMLGKFFRTYIFKNVNRKYTWCLGLGTLICFSIFHGFLSSFPQMDNYKELLGCLNPWYNLSYSHYDELNYKTCIFLIFLSVALNNKVILKQIKLYMEPRVTKDSKQSSKTDE